MNLLQRRREMMVQKQGGVLPEGYTQLNYIENTNNARFSIRFYLPFRYETEFAPDLANVGGQYACIFGVNSSYQAAFVSNGKAYIGNATSAGVFYANGVKAKVSGQVTSSSSTTTYIVDGEDTGLRRPSNSSIWYFFAGGTSYPARGKMYGFKMWNANDALIHHLIPCKDPNDVYGMYDIIGETFYGSETSHPFIGG